MDTNMNFNVALSNVHSFNTLAGNLVEVNLDSVDNQLSYCFEELQETITALEEGNMVELLDGACDMFVTGAGLLLKLEAMGFNVAEALARVNANNLTKFPANKDYAEDIVEDGHTPTFNRDHGRWVIKDAAGKVRKPLNFVPVDLSDLVPHTVKKDIKDVAKVVAKVAATPAKAKGAK